MPDWRDPVPSDYKLPPRNTSFDEHAKKGERKSFQDKGFFPVFKYIVLSFLLLYFFVSLNVVRAKVDDLSKQLGVAYPEISNPEELTEEDIEKLVDYYDLNDFNSIDERLLIDSEDIDSILASKISEEELNRKFSITSMILNEVKNKRMIIHNKDELNTIVQDIEAILQ